MPRGLGADDCGLGDSRPAAPRLARALVRDPGRSPGRRGGARRAGQPGPSVAGRRTAGGDRGPSPAAGSARPATRHGTAVASLIFGRHAPDSPVAGMAPGCRGLVVPIFGDADAAARRAVPAGVLAARSGAGDPAGGRARGVDHQHQRRAVLAGVGRLADHGRRGGPGRRAAGVLVVAAAGNDGCECAHVPAALPGVLAVGAMDSLGRPARLEQLGRPLPVRRPARARRRPARRPGRRRPSAVAGTSFATAIVSGARRPAREPWRCGGADRSTGARIREILLDSAHKCLDDSISCRRHLAGRLDLLAAGTLLRTRTYA